MNLETSYLPIEVLGGRDRAANEAAHKSAHDPREDLHQKSGVTRSIYWSRKRAPAHNQNRPQQTSEECGTPNYRGAAHPLCFTDEVLDHEFTEGFKPVNIEAYDGTTGSGLRTTSLTEQKTPLHTIDGSCSAVLWV